MKRIRVAASMFISAALMTTSFGIPAALGHEGAKVAVNLPAPFCASLIEFFVDKGGVDPAVRTASIDIQIAGPPPLIAPLDWSLWESVGVSYFRCDGPEPGTLSSGLALVP